MANNIHPTAIIEHGAQTGKDVTIEAYSYIGKMVVIGDGTVVRHHATVDGKTILGNENVIHPYAYIGGPTQDLKYSGGEPGLRVGNNNIFREYCTAHVATKPNDFTEIGNGNVLLAYSHVAHDCVIKDNTIISSMAALGGHVHVDDFANIGWNAGIHQFCHIGKYAMVGAGSKVTHDILPYMLADGLPAIVRCPNFVNLKRKNFSQEQMSQIKTIYKIFYMRGLSKQRAIEEIKQANIEDEILNELLSFISHGTRGI